MKPKSKLRAFLAIVGSSLLTITSASAGTYYWDSDGDGSAGFGSAAGTWSSAGTGSKWSTSPTGDGVGGAAVTDYATTIADDLFFGTAYSTSVPPLYPFGGVITINGTVNAKSIFCGYSTPNFVAGASPVFNFAAEGRFEHVTEGTATLPAMNLTGATTSMTWKAGFIDNLSIENVINNAAKNIFEGTGSFIFVKGGAELGSVGTPIVFNGGGLRLVSGFPYSSMSAFNTDHPITINPNVSFGLAPFGSSFTVDMPLNLGTGGFYIAGQNPTSPVIITQSQNHTGGTFLVSGVAQISDNAQLGDITSPLVFGSGPSGTGEGANGTLRITGTTMTSLGARSLVHTPDKGVSFEIADAANTFTVDQPLNQGTGGFTKSGLGSLIINTTSTYTGLTTVSGGTLSYANSAGLPTTTVTVNGADALLDLGAYNPSVTTVTLQNGNVTGSGTLTGTSFVLNGASPAVMNIPVKLAGAGATLAKSSTGTATLSGDNSSLGGAVTLSSGTLNVNSSSALGTGAVTISGGTIDNTSGSAKTLSTNNTITFNGNFTFGGSNNLNLGSGAITNGGSRTITLNGTSSTLAFGGVMTNGVAGNQTTTVNGAGNTLTLGGYALSNSATSRTGIFNGTGNMTITGAVTNGGTATASLLTYSGSGTLTLKGANTYAGNTTISSGCLALEGGSQNSAITVSSGAFLGFTLGQTTTSTKAVTLSAGHKVRITGTPTPGTSYTLLTTTLPATISGTPVLETPLASHALMVEGTNTLVLRSLSTPFQDWALLKGLDGTPGKENGKTDDPDGDGKNNNFEFAFNGNPLNGSDNGMMAGIVQDASAPVGNELTLVVAVRDGATFANAGSPVVQTATVDGVTYTIEGTLDLVTIPGSAVSHAAGPADTAPLATGLPDLTGTAWEYHTFKLDASEGLGGKGFLRAKAE